MKPQRKCFAMIFKKIGQPKQMERVNFKAVLGPVFHFSFENSIHGLT